LDNGNASEAVVGVECAPEAKADSSVGNEATVSANAVNLKRNIREGANSGPAGASISDDRIGRCANDVVSRSAILPAPAEYSRGRICPETPGDKDDNTKSDGE